MDPILLNGVDDSNEWLLEEMGRGDEDAEDELVFNDDTWTWGAVANATGIRELLTYTRQQTRSKKTAATAFSSRPSSSKGKGNEVIQDEECIDEDIGEEEEIYKCSCES